MKVCEKCGDEIGGKDGENECPKCEQNKTKRATANAQRRARDEVMRSCGMKKVRGALGGTYWE